MAADVSTCFAVLGVAILVACALVILALQKSDISDWERELERLEALESPVSCGDHLASRCSACAADGCFGDCVWLPVARRCSSISAIEPVEPPFMVMATTFNPARDALHVVDTSPFAAAALMLLLDGARHGQVPHATASLEMSSLLPTARRRLGRPMHVALNGSSNEPRRPRGRGPIAAASSTWHVAWLREPLEVLRSEHLLRPELCTPLADASARCHSASLSRPSRAARGVNETSNVLERLLVCCPNPLARSLIATLPRSEATQRCLRGGTPAVEAAPQTSSGEHHQSSTGCDDATMYTLARRALLGLACFGLVSAPELSSALLERSLPLRLPALSPATVRAMHHEAWPWRPRQLARLGDPLSPAQIRKWRRASAVDLAIYELGVGVLAFRSRALGLPGVDARTVQRWLPPAPPNTDVDEEHASVGESRIFATAHGASARHAEAVAPPLTFVPTRDTLVFVHIAKCGGTSFNRRLMSLYTEVPCTCRPERITNASWHNGHRVVQPRACVCARAPLGTMRAAWSSLALEKIPPRNRRSWAFLQAQWLVSPETTGWLGGVHTPVRVLQTCAPCPPNARVPRPSSAPPHPTPS